MIALGFILVGLSQFVLENTENLPGAEYGFRITYIRFCILITWEVKGWCISSIFIDYDTMIQLEKQWDLSKVT